MNTPIIDLEELLDEVQDMIEEKIAIEGDNQNEWKYQYRYRILGFV